MTLEEVESVLCEELRLLPDAKERGNARTYFFEQVCWHPSHSTRVVRVAFDSTGTVTSIRLCVSSDNNNSMFVRMPLQPEALRQAVVTEIAALRRTGPVPSSPLLH